MDQESIHDLNFKSAMIQSWNKLCFNKNAYFELSLSLPGTSTVGGFWPGIWTMGNLGRPGYGATTEGEGLGSQCRIPLTLCRSLAVLVRQL
jgi:beta-glucanase (GH16 family)